MLVRILADNPGKNFTRNIDSKFTVTVKELLRDGRDMSVQQILRETLDSFETNKPNDETLAGLREMWKKEKLKMEKRGSMAVSTSVLQALYQADVPSNHPTEWPWYHQDTTKANKIIFLGIIALKASPHKLN